MKEVHDFIVECHSTSENVSNQTLAKKVKLMVLNKPEIENQEAQLQTWCWAILRCFRNSMQFKKFPNHVRVEYTYAGSKLFSRTSTEDIESIVMDRIESQTRKNYTTVASFCQFHSVRFWMD